MNNPYATQSQIEARIASRLANPERIRRALRLDNPFMYGNETGDHPRPEIGDTLPTPNYAA